MHAQCHWSPSTHWHFINQIVAIAIATAIAITITITIIITTHSLLDTVLKGKSLIVFVNFNWLLLEPNCLLQDTKHF